MIGQEEPEASGMRTQVCDTRSTPLHMMQASELDPQLRRIVPRPADKMKLASADFDASL